MKVAAQSKNLPFNLIRKMNILWIGSRNFTKSRFFKEKKGVERECNKNVLRFFTLRFFYEKRKIIK